MKVGESERERERKGKGERKSERESEREKERERGRGREREGDSCRNTLIHTSCALNLYRTRSFFSWEGGREGWREE